MKIHHYDPETGLYRGTTDAQPDPVELDRAQKALLAKRSSKAHADYAKAISAGGDLDQAEAARMAADQAAAVEASGLEPVAWLIPAHATRLTLPNLEEGDQARFVEGGWSVEPIPAEVAPDPVRETPAPPVDVAELARRRRDGEITGLRWLIERHSDEVALGDTTTLSPDRIVQVLRHIQALRAVPDQAGFPDAIDWPVLPPEAPTKTTETQTGEDPQ